METIIILIMSILIVACSPTGGGGGGGGSGGLSNLLPSPAPSPAPASSPSPAPAPSPAPCASFIGTDWLPDGNPQLTANKQWRAGQLPEILDLDMTVANPQFTQEETISGVQSCTRDFNSGTQFGGQYSLVWNTPSSGPCTVVEQWVIFSLTACNELTVTFKDDQGTADEVQLYKPR